jgi:3-polyprenyl-4-hydroxybenzoate decarboxylase
VPVQSTFETLKSELHGLPMPAPAEIVLEAEIFLDHLRSEGTLRRWTGYNTSPYGRITLCGSDASIIAMLPS